MILPFELTIGSVVDFDAERGLGTVRDASGATAMFHCTAIGDGTRRVDPGTAVAFVVGPAGPGRWEAIEVHPINSGGCLPTRTG